VLGGRVYDYYGCGEVNSIAYQCERRDGYHLVDEKIILESTALGEDDPTSGGGRVLLTDLSNFAFPFIRYENGDFVERSAEPCACGRGLGRLARVIGRVHDFIVTTSGDLLAGEFFPHLFKWVDHVKQFQVVQERLGEVRVLVVVESGFDDAFLIAKLREYLGSAMRIDVERVDEIPKTAAGKRRITISRLTADEIARVGGANPVATRRPSR
jgi:phenylacetate-CoA ligase